MSDFLLTQVINFGTPLIGDHFAGRARFPVGASVVVIAAGAFSQQGVLNWYEAIIIGLAGAVLGDMLSYGMGHYAKGWVEKRFGNSPAWINASKSFHKRQDWPSISRAGWSLRLPSPPIGSRAAVDINSPASCSTM